ncbi:alpha/beta hydrolase [Brevundimonas sp. PAMC22021]|uniref:alpha/beta hydrolase n=1 Tax=Brevundimonas sp. PAMC22021 TaxID=2861285 RepID=UPI001C62643B|nr:alpha/beta hydrolase [Brevundimonas sp. PAMC22021]QYF87733.1 alpha/beta hydrolase [Brevundimonas sp. PAMC22021]
MDIARRSLLAMAAFAGGAAMSTRTSAQSAVAPADPTETLRLWPGRAPGGEGVSVTGVVTERSTDPAFHDRFAQYTTDPLMTVFRPERPNGSALLLIPGGGYRWSVVDKEGFDVARVFAASGTTCFVLRYRLPGDGWAAGADAPLQDPQRAIRLIRSRSAEFDLDPKRIAILGASAGGHLAGLASARTDAVYADIDAADHASFRPDLSILMYPVATMADPFVHAGSRDYLLGSSPSPERIAAYSLERMAWRGAAPVFLVHAIDDASVPVENSLQLLSTLKAHQVRAEAHLFQEGGHGFGVRLIQGRPAEAWPDLVRTWAKRLDFAL